MGFGVFLKWFGLISDMIRVFHRQNIWFLVLQMCFEVDNIGLELAMWWYYYYGHSTKCAKRTEAGPKAQLRARL